MIKVLFLNTAHFSFDDRVFYHQAQSLLKKGYEVEIISTKESVTNVIDSIILNSFNDNQLNQKQKINEIIKRVEISKPKIIIADTPLAVFAANQYKKKNTVKIIYDITEWYPSKKNLSNLKGIKKISKLITLYIVNIYAGLITDQFIFGEYYKSFPFRFIFLWKPYLFLSYYPNLEFIKQYPFNRIDKIVNITYSGIINKEKGIDNVVKSVILSAITNPLKTFNLKIIGQFPTKKDKIHFDNLTKDLTKNITISIENLKNFKDFCNIIGDTHLFLDLRKKDFENTFCLPIKLFYYLACGRPVIYSNLKSIKREIPINDFGFICEPTDVENISYNINRYVNNHDLYSDHCKNALQISKNTYNWQKIENKFIDFINKTF